MGFLYIMNPILKCLGIPLLLAGVPATQTLQAQNTAITVAEAEKLSNQLDTSIGNGNAEILNHLISFPVFVDRMKSRSSLRDNMDTLTKIADAYGLFKIGIHTAEIVKNGSYHLVRGYQKDDEMHLLFRAFGDGGLGLPGYHTGQSKRLHKSSRYIFISIRRILQQHFLGADCGQGTAG